MRSLFVTLGLAACAALSVARPVAAQDARSLLHDDALRLSDERNAGLVLARLERERQGELGWSTGRSYLPEVAIETAARETGPSATMDRQRAIEAIGTLSYTSPYGQSVKLSASATGGLSSNLQGGRSVQLDVSQALLRGGF